MRVILPIRHPIGGIRTYLKYTYGHLAEAFDPDELHMTIVIPEDYSKELDVIGDDLRGVRIEKHIADGKRPAFAIARKMSALLKKNRFDVIHAQGITCGVIAASVNTLFRIPLLITFHETFDQEVFGGFGGKLKRIVIESLLKRADVLNVVSRDAEDNLMLTFPALRKYRGRLCVIQNGIDVEYFRQRGPENKTIWGIDGISESAFVVGFLGRYMPEKGFPILIRAVELLRKQMDGRTRYSDIRVLAVGWGEFIREYQAHIRERGLERNFVFIDFQNDVRWVLRQIHLLAVPSLREASPILPIEGLVSGTPIVASRCIGLKEVLEATPARLFRAGDADDLADNIFNIMTGYESIKNEFTAFSSSAAERFDVRKSALALYSILSLTAGNR